MKLVSLIKPTLLSALIIMSLPSFALNLQQAMSSLGDAKAQGLVGEKPDGYLGAVSHSGNADEIVKLINEARLAQYQRLAQDNKIALADVEAMAGQKAIEKTQSGQYIQVNQKWAKKP